MGRSTYTPQYTDMEAISRLRLFFTTVLKENTYSAAAT